jgi:hypothetical protein
VWTSPVCYILLHTTLGLGESDKGVDLTEILLVDDNDTGEQKSLCPLCSGCLYCQAARRQKKQKRHFQIKERHLWQSFSEETFYPVHATEENVKYMKARR